MPQPAQRRPVGDALHQLVGRDVDEHDVRDRAPRLGQHRVQLFRLRDRAREAVEEEALSGVGLGEPLVHGSDHDLVRDERAPHP